LQKVSWGIIGLGKIALKFAESFKDIKNAQLVSIASKDINRLKAFKEKFKIDNDLSFKNYEELLECQKIDIVYIALPNSYHYDWIIKCIEKKKEYW
jgi:predicted dehydrogenase